MSEVPNPFRPWNEGRGLVYGETMRQRIESGYGYPIKMFEEGSVIRIDLHPELVDSEDSSAFLSGTIVDKKYGLIEVDETTEQELVDQVIGIGSYIPFATPARTIEIENFQGTIAPRRSMTYFYPEDLKKTEYGLQPTQYHHQPFRFSRLEVAGEEIFDYKGLIP